MTQAGLAQPKIEDSADGVLITIFRTALAGSEKGSEKTWEKLLALIVHDPNITIKQMVDELGLSTRAIEKQLANLQKKQRLTRKGGDKGGRWSVLTPETDEK